MVKRLIIWLLKDELNAKYLRGRWDGYSLCETHILDKSKGTEHYNFNLEILM